MLPCKLAFVDTETTGFSASRDRIIEIGIIRVEDGVVTKKYQTLLNPQCYLPQEVEYLTGIRKNDLESAPTFYNVKNEIYETLRDCVFVAHNVRFDYSFLKNEFKREEIMFSPKQICSVKLSRHFFPRHRRHGLDNIIERFNFSCQNRHRAFDDAWVVWEFYQKLRVMFSEEKLTEAFLSFSKKPTIPVGLCAEDIKEVPQSPGVYIFYGEENIPLYIGKSVNLRDRINSHFSADYASPMEMKISQQIKRIKIIKTPGELGALLKEAQLIKQLCPMYNRKLRYAKKLLCLMRKQTSKGYNSVIMENLEAFTKETLQNILAFAKSKKQAKDFLREISKDHNLCQRLVGVENTLSECFAYRLGRCKGACKGTENVLSHNMRFDLAFSKTKVKKWPFAGPIMIAEKNEDRREAQAFFINNWCFLGSMTLESENLSENFSFNYLIKEIDEQQEIPFDLDTYKIIQAFIGKKANQKKITTFGKQSLISPFSLIY